jgi:hypothetical protein
MKAPPVFVLQFDPSLIDEKASRYAYSDDDAVLAAGARIRSGEYTKANLEKIFLWKTNGRGKSRLLRNSDDEIKDALQLASNARTERSALAVLTGLNGVDLPVASAILTAIFPETYTVLDFRALEALGQNPSSYTINFYIAYLDACRGLVAIHNLPGLRHLDRALWQWSKDKSKEGSCS